MMEQAQHRPCAGGVVLDAHIVNGASTIGQAEVGDVDVRPLQIEDEPQSRPHQDLLDLGADESLHDLVVHERNFRPSGTWLAWASVLSPEIRRVRGSSVTAASPAPIELASLAPRDTPARAPPRRAYSTPQP